MTQFWKYHGIGNDFIVFDGTKGDPVFTPEQIAFMCDRNFGIGSDGVVYVNPGIDGSDVTIESDYILPTQKIQFDADL